MINNLETWQLIGLIVAGVLISGGSGFGLSEFTDENYEDDYNDLLDNYTELEEKVDKLENEAQHADYYSTQLNKTRENIGELNDTIDDKEKKIEDQNQTINDLEKAVNRTIVYKDLDQYKVEFLDRNINLNLFIIFNIPISISVFGISGIIGVYKKKWHISLIIALSYILLLISPFLA